ncbi:MAG: HyaD/HybD family hydrogenase maturation endopeptidase [Syntrophobacteraceae bacterium]
MGKKRILVLGVGNILLHDEGVGVRVIERLQADYDFSENVELMDGGTLGVRLLDPIVQADYVIVVDAVRNGEPPGTLYHLDVDFLAKRVAFKNSLHQADMVETLAYAEMLGKRPDAVIVGVEPEDISPWGLELTETVADRVPDMCQRVLDEIQKAGGSSTPQSDESKARRSSTTI